MLVGKKAKRLISTSQLASRLACLLMVLAMAAACQSSNENQAPQNLKAGQGGRYYGGIFRLSEPEYIKTLFPHGITDVYSYRVASQVYEGLFTFNPYDLNVVPNLVQDYTLDSTRRIYTMQLKQGVFFHDDPCFDQGRGRQLTAQDVAHSLTALCKPSTMNRNHGLLLDVLKGARSFYNAHLNDQADSARLPGIKVLGPNTIQFELEKPDANFPVRLARPACFIYAPEAQRAYGTDMRRKAVGTGPFKLQSIDEEISINLVRHGRYHRKDELGNPLPFLEALSIQFLKDKKSELLEFKKGNLDMMYRLPTESIIEVLEGTAASSQGTYSQYQLQRVPEMVSRFLMFQTQRSVFANPNIRKAFSYAIDRQKLLDYVLNGEGYAPGHHGVVPPVFPAYNTNAVPGYAFNLDSARFYLSKAGFPEGRGFPPITLMLNADGNRNTNVAVEIQKQLQDYLNVKVDLQVMPFAQLDEQSQQGSFDLLSIAWVADYPNPESFLSLFYDNSQNSAGSSYPNVSRYSNPRFNQLYTRALNASTPQQANALFFEAEKVLMEDAPVLVLWYDEGYRLLQRYVKNFPNNPMQYRDFSQVYFDQVEQLTPQ